AAHDRTGSGTAHLHDVHRGGGRHSAIRQPRGIGVVHRLDPWRAFELHADPTNRDHQGGPGIATSHADAGESFLHANTSTRYGSAVGCQGEGTSRQGHRDHRI